MKNLPLVAVLMMTMQLASPTMVVALGTGNPQTARPQPLLAEGYTPPLTVPQLNPNLMITLVGMPRLSERAIYDTLTTDDDRRRYLYSRGYFRWCRDVIQNDVLPRNLPRLPKRTDWNRAFLEDQAEAVNILDVALGMKREARRAEEQND